MITKIGIDRHLDPADNIQSFYHLRGNLLDGTTCQGTACFVASHLNPSRWKTALAQNQRVHCLGKCYQAPASIDETLRPAIEARCRQPVVLGRICNGPVRTLSSYVQQGGYSALKSVLRRTQDEVISEMEASQLRGRGGAGFSAGKKWRAVFRQSPLDKFVVANADEGDPGAFVDRFILEDDPHCVIEAMLICGYAVGATRGYLYLRKEYPDAERILAYALQEARANGLLGNSVQDSKFAFDITLTAGLGSYLCGEETALLNAIEGKRPEVRVRPPYPTEAGLFGKPTVVNNVETLANVPWIMLNGGAVFNRLGFSSSRGTKAISLNSLFRRPGLYEVEFGITVGEIVTDIGGGLRSGVLKGVMIGGPLAGIIPPQLLATRFGFEELHAIGASVGHGGVVAFDEHTSITDLVQHVFEFGAFESCGKCTPCRLGSRYVATLVSQHLRSMSGAEQFARWSQLITVLREASLCGHGTGMAEFAESVSHYYRQELESCFASQ